MVYNVFDFWARPLLPQTAMCRSLLPHKMNTFPLSPFFSFSSALFCPTEHSQPLFHHRFAHSFLFNGGGGDVSFPCTERGEGSTSATPLECADPQFRALTLLECAVAKMPSRKSFRMRRSEKRWGGGPSPPFSACEHPAGTPVLPAPKDLSIRHSSTSPNLSIVNCHLLTLSQVEASIDASRLIAPALTMGYSDAQNIHYEPRTMSYGTLPSLFLNAADNLPTPRAQMVRRDGQWEAIGSQEFLRRVAGLSSALVELGVKPGDRVGLFSTNRPEWHTADFAINGAGAITVPIYFNESSERMTYILKHCGAKVVFVTGKPQLEKLLSVRSNLPELENIIAADAGAEMGLNAVRRLSVYLEWSERPTPALHPEIP